ncbi:MAG: SurA N-terminal domain-containing protein [Bacteroidales bacterium]|nr:SurA N-terminal domain-containing protein [Bacteroidales bacterium]
MAVLEKIRVKFGILITVLVALALLSFILDPQTLRSAADRFSSDNKVGSMNGKSISYREYYEQLNNMTELAKLMGQNPSSEEQQAQLRDAAWHSIYENEVFIPKATAAGLYVGEDEMIDLTQGSNISPVLMQQPMFLDANGNFSREALVSFVQSIDADQSGSYSAYWSFLEESVYREQLLAKYASLVQNSDFLTDLEKERLVAEGNVTADVDFVFVPVSFLQDSTVTVSDEEIRSYYNEHKEGFRQPDNRDIEYVMWEVVPSDFDLSDARAEFDELYKEFATDDNLKAFVTLHSDSKWNPYYYTEDQLAANPEFQETAFHAPMGTVSPVVTENNTIGAVRVTDVRNMADSAHVFYKVFAIDKEQEADEFLAQQSRRVEESEFTEMGWLTQEIILSNGLSDFSPVFDTDRKVIKVKSTANQAVFVLYVPEKTRPVKKVQLATLLKNVLPSDETYRDFQMKAVEFADACDGKYDKFQKLALEQNLPVIPINNMVQSNRRIGPADNAREVVSWVFDKKTKAGDVSDLKIVDNKYYFVTAVTKTRKEGYVDVKEVASQIKTILSARKSVEKKKAEVEKQIAGLTDLEQIAETLGTTVSHYPGLSFASSQLNQTDPALSGAVAVADEGKIGVVGGNLGVYVYDVTARNTGTFFSEADAQTQLARNASYHNSILQSVIANEAEIKDNRARFF